MKEKFLEFRKQKIAFLICNFLANVVITTNRIELSLKKVSVSSFFTSFACSSVGVHTKHQLDSVDKLQLYPRFHE